MKDVETLLHLEQRFALLVFFRMEPALFVSRAGFFGRLAG